MAIGRDSVASYWLAALGFSGLEQIKHLAVEAEMSGCETDSMLAVLPMTDDLRDLIVRILGKEGEGGMPHLSLTGIREEERVKVPKEWKVVMDQWDEHNEGDYEK
jgi:hypothetical protein